MSGEQDSSRIDDETPEQGFEESGGEDSSEEMEDLLSALGIESEEDEGTEESEDAEGGPEEETFYDATKVPAELRPTFREMQGALTRKTQALAEKERKLEQLLGNAGNIEEAGYKARILDGLLENPRVVRYLERLNDGEIPDDLDGEEAESELLDRKVKKAVEPIQRELSEHRMRAQAEKALEEFKRKHPDWEKYRSGMEKAWSTNKLLDLEGAYRWAVYDVAETKKRTAAKSSRSVERGAGKFLPANSKNSSTKVSNIDDALRLAFREKGLKYS